MQFVDNLDTKQVEKLLCNPPKVFKEFTGGVL